MSIVIDRNGTAGAGLRRGAGWRRAGFVLGLASLLGCGQEFRLPPTPPPEPIPDAGRFHYEKSWNLPAPGDLAAAGSYLYVIVANTGADPDTNVQSRVEVYLTGRPDPTPPPLGRIHPFTGLTRPVLLCVARRESTWVFVADAGDSTIKRFHFTGGAPRHSFQHRSYRLIDADTTYADVLVWKEMSGLAADDRLNIYLADAERDTIGCYDEEGRFLRAVSTAGSGDGYAISARGLAWNGEELLVSDTGQNRLVLLDEEQSETASRPPIGLRLNEPRLLLPEDVAGDRNRKFAYVADTGQNRVLKYLLTGEFIDSVYSARSVDPRLGDPILAPRHIAVEEPLVFVSDPDHNRLVAFALADSF
jgi:DNA-binding beta-propeller fold protein YncE